MPDKTERAENSLELSTAKAILDRMQESFNRDIAEVRYIIGKVHLERKADEVRGSGPNKV